MAKSPALDQLDLVVDPRDDAIALLTAGLVSIWAVGYTESGLWV